MLSTSVPYIYPLRLSVHITLHTLFTVTRAFDRVPGGHGAAGGRVPARSVCLQTSARFRIFTRGYSLLNLILVENKGVSVGLLKTALSIKPQYAAA